MECHGGDDGSSGSRGGGGLSLGPRGGRSSSEGPLLPRACGWSVQARGGSNCWQQPHQGSGWGPRVFFFFFSQLLHGWAIRSKGKAFPKSQLDGAGRRRRVFFPPSSLWKIRLRRWRGKEAVRGLQDQDQDPQLMDRGLRLLALPAALASSQVGSPPGVATPASTYSRTVGGWGGHGCPGNAGEPTGLGRQELPSLLSPRARATPALPELGWLSSSRLSAVGQEGSWG